MMLFIIRIIGTFLLKLRYRVKVNGLDKVKKGGNKGILFLPNHPALIDPVIVSAILTKDFKPRALADEKQIRMQPLKFFAKALRLLSLPDIGIAGKAGIEKVEQQLGECVNCLRNGDNVLFYPAGRIYRSRYEKLRANGGVRRMLDLYPEVRIVLVRTTGLWGSSFGRSIGYQSPFGEILLKHVKHILANFIFFTPKRDVTIDLVDCPADFPRDGTKEEINRYLEEFYNATSQPNTYVPYYWFERGGPQVRPEPEELNKKEESINVPDDVRKTVYAKLHEMSINKQIRDSDTLGTNLGLDSLMITELQAWIQQEFGHQVNNPETLRTVSSVLVAATGQSDGLEPLRPIPPQWFIQPDDTRIKIPDDATTITGAFLENAKKYPNRVLLADQSKGVCTYKQMIVSIMVLRKAIAKIPGDRVGILMPACLPVYIVYLATLFANKIPVLINWTVGLRNMRHCLKNAETKHILTSSALIERLEGRGIDFAEIKENFHYLEEMASSISILTKLSYLLLSKISWASLRNAEVPETAAILFTSGSENLPKTVPLTHVNLIEDVRSAMRRVDLRFDDCILAMLPPFHSFGIIINFIMPACANMRLVYHPNPTEGDMLARLISAYQATMSVGTPTFIAGIFRNATPEQLKSIRLIITGAEKCPATTYKLFAEKRPDAHILEGYGITECGPIVSLNQIGAEKQGTLGPVIDILRWTIRDEDLKPVQQGQTGMLYVKGVCVFSGYLNFDGPSPFVTIDNEAWYRTGDLVLEDKDGHIVFQGRKKRFVKIAGEMVSLPAVEEVLLNRYRTPDMEEIPLAVEALGTEEMPAITLFTILDIKRDEVNQTIRDAGLSPIHCVKNIVNIPAIPVLGTGKTDYRSLKAMDVKNGHP
ncbi:MAG: AMP-binding protein [Lentisphaerae bacterium]|jgi:acyl-CoA synthetase (AMP-forming)/AMP-acid ligase II/1-acyl-sn-glycerol-3-phosphate acyltransferase/acyl carrier protein|nr:AMP-binding protein [Lentisphaerota bacterium]